jgi:hypothetical protein
MAAFVVTYGIEESCERSLTASTIAAAHAA